MVLDVDVEPKYPHATTGMRVLEAFVADGTSGFPEPRHRSSGGLQLFVCLHKVRPPTLLLSSTDETDRSLHGSSMDPFRAIVFARSGFGGDLSC